MKKLKDGWILKKVGELFDIQLGKMLNQKAIELSPQYPYLGNSNVRWGSFDMENLKTMHFSEKEINKFSLQKNDILMCEGGEVGRCAIWENENAEIYYQKALHRLRSKGKILPSYFYHYMTFIAGTKLLYDQTTKTSIAHLTREKLSALKIPVPPLNKQIQIAETLSTWDNAIQTTEKLIENSRQQKKALRQILLNGKNSLNWKEKALEELVVYQQPTKFLVKDTTYNDNYKTPVLTAGKSFILGYTNEDDGIYNNLPVIIFDDFTTDSQFVTFPFKIKSSAIKLLTAKENVCIKYIFEAMQMIDFEVGGHQRHWISIFSKLKIRIPVFEEQQKIAEILSTADQEIETLQRKLECLKLEKGALMQRLL